MSASPTVSPAAAATFRRCWADLEPVGREADGTYRRLAWTQEDLTLRAWFRAELATRALVEHVDRAGNIWGWWGDPDADGPGIATGSHLDSVPGGGAYDGPLGVVAALAAVDELRAQGFTPHRPIAVVCFSDEEGGRFGIACVGSRVLTGALEPARALALTDDAGTALSQALEDARVQGDDSAPAPEAYGPDRQALGRVARFVEVHVEQGHSQEASGDPLAVGTAIWPHGRWRVTINGTGNHAGTTALEDRDDPVIGLAEFVLAVRRSARQHEARATVGRVLVEPGGTNVIASRATAWLDIRAVRTESIEAVLADLAFAEPVRESWTAGVDFDDAVVTDLATATHQLGLDAPRLGTGAGHDAGILSQAGIPSAMIFVRNPTGISHAVGEGAREEDCLAAVAVLARALAQWSSARAAR